MNNSVKFLTLSNITDETSSLVTSCPLKYVYVVGYFVLPVISAFGIVSNLFSSIVFFQIIQNEKINGKMFKYLFIKAINDFLQFSFQIFSPIYYCINCDQNKSYSANVWFIGFYYYGESVVELTSGWLETLATFDCLCFITKRFTIINSKIFFWTSVIFLHVYAVIFYMFWIFSYQITSESSNSFTLILTSFYYSDFVKYIKYLHAIQRDFTVLLLLLILNILILIKVKKTISKKRQLLAGNTASGSNSVTNQPSSALMINVKKTEKNSELMIILTGVNYFLGHIGSILYYLPFPATPQFWSCFFEIDLIPFYLSYILNNFIYYYFNKIYKKYSHKTLNVFKKKLSFN